MASLLHGFLSRRLPGEPSSDPPTPRPPLGEPSQNLGSLGAAGRAENEHSGLLRGATSDSGEDIEDAVDSAAAALSRGVGLALESAALERRAQWRRDRARLAEMELTSRMERRSRLRDVVADLDDVAEAPSLRGGYGPSFGSPNPFTGGLGPELDAGVFGTLGGLAAAMEEASAAAAARREEDLQRWQRREDEAREALGVRSVASVQTDREGGRVGEDLVPLIPTRGSHGFGSTSDGPLEHSGGPRGLYRHSEGRPLRLGGAVGHEASQAPGALSPAVRRALTSASTAQVGLQRKAA